MTRSVLIRKQGEEPSLVPEDKIPLEAELHEALTKYPDLLPMQDLGFGQTVVVGREASLASGSADLVLLDDRGQVALVEVKKEGNPDTRRVVAQLLDYAGAMWGQTLPEFEASVLQPFLKEQGNDAVGLSEFLTAAFGAVPGESDGLDPGLDKSPAIEAALAGRLETGRFALVVAAPQIPPGVERVLEYLNRQGLRLFAIEFSYFKKDGVEVLVPRIAVAPTQVVGAPHTADTSEWDREAFLATMPQQAVTELAELLDGCVERGAELQPNPAGGVSVILRKAGQKRTLVELESTKCWITQEATGPFAKEPFEKLMQALGAIGASGIKGGWFGAVEFAKVPSEKLQLLNQALFTACEELLA